MEIIKQIFLQNAFSSLKLSAVVILLFALTKPIVNRYTAGFRYYSWLMVMLVFLIPFSAMGLSYTVDLSAVTNTVNTQTVREWYSENAPEHSFTEEYQGYTRVESENEDEEVQYVPVTKTAVMKMPVDIAAILAALWLLGTAIYFELHIVRYIQFRRGMKRLCDNIYDDRILSALNAEKQRLGISRGIALKLFPVTDTPMLTGLFRPEIILPHTDYADEELKLILRHELFHLKRNDILYQFVTLIFVSLHWFNPFVYLMAKAVEIDGETSCDEKTLEGKSYEEKIFYGEMLLKFLKTTTQKRSYMTTTFFGGKKGMKKRLNLIKSRKTRRKGAAAMAVVTIAAVVMSISAAAMGNNYFDSVFEGDTSYLADFIKTEKRSVEDDRFRLTLEQYLVAENRAMLICSFEAKTEDAKAEMNEVDENGHSTFNGMDFLNFGPTDYDKSYLHSSTCGHLGGGKFDTENKRYYILQSDSIDNKENIDFKLSTDRIKDAPKIIVPMDYNMETKTVDLGSGMSVAYNPVSIAVTLPYAEEENTDCDWCEWNGNYFYFRMKSGEIKSFYQLYDYSGTDDIFDESDTKVSQTLSAWSYGIIEPDEIKSIIVNDTEYPVDNPSASKPVIIDEHLKPFVINPYVKDHLWIPLRDLCNGLGAEIKWDDKTKTAKFSYQGSVYELTAGKAGIIVDGKKCDFGDKPSFIDEQGRLIVPPYFNGYNNYTYMTVEMHGINTYIENSDGSRTINPNAKWHIIP